MAKFGIEMLSGKTFEITAATGDEAKKEAYRLVDREQPGIEHGDPARRVKCVTPLDK